MNIQEFAEWLQEQSDKYSLLANEARGNPKKLYMCGYMRGRSMGLEKALEKLISLDSSHDLPSTKG